LFVSSEIYPLAKTGGLADVGASLPSALSAMGVEMRLAMPGYPGAIEAAGPVTVQASVDDFMGAGPLRILAARIPDTGLPVWLVDCPALFRRSGGLYQDEHGEDWPDNARRFAIFDHAAAQLALGLLVPGWRADIVPAIVERGAQFAILGEGVRALEERFREAAHRFPGRTAARIGYVEPLAHRFQAGADILLHPARFEPCGLTQLYALRYGTLPVVRSTGGLSDTIVDATDRTIQEGTASGFVFRQPDAADLIDGIERALAQFRQPLAWRKLQRLAMTRDFGWKRSAERYLALYLDLARRTDPVADPQAPELAPERASSAAEFLNSEAARIRLTGNT
jgi:glycogen synthase